MTEKNLPDLQAKDIDDSVEAAATRRTRLSGPPGLAGLIQQPRLLVLVLITTLGNFCYGYEQGAYSQVLVMPAFIDDPRFARIGNDASYKGWSVSYAFGTLGLGGWFGALVNGYLSDLISRRWSLFIGGLICLLGTALTTGAQNPDYMFLGRFFIGWSVGSLSACVPLYNSEIAAPELRGTAVSIQQFAICCGICLSFWIGYGTNFISDTDSASWRVCLAIQGVPALLLCLFCVLYIPYTPRWLVSRGRIEEARRNLAWIRSRAEDDELVTLEMLEIQAEAMFEAEINAEKFPSLSSGGPWDMFRLQVAKFGQLFTTKHMFHRTAVACLMQFFQQMSGIDCIVYYAPTIFAGMGLSGRTTSLLASGVIGVVFVITTIPAIMLIDKVGRRPLLIFGGVGMAACLVIVAALVGSFQDNWSSHQSGAWTAVVFIWLYIGFFGCSWGPVSWVVISEVFPLSTRGQGSALGASTNWMTNFIVGYVVPLMLVHMTYFTYIFFLVFMLLGIGYSIWVLPETKGKSLEEMDLAFGSGEGQQDLERMKRIQASLGLIGQPGREDSEQKAAQDA